MTVFPSRVPIGLIFALLLAFASAPLVFMGWRHSQGTLEAYYLWPYMKAIATPSAGLLTRQPIISPYYIVTVDGRFATYQTPLDPPHKISGHFESYTSANFADWIRKAIYRGKTPGELLQFPILLWAGIAMLLVVFGGAYDFRRRRRAREGEQLRGPNTMTASEFNRLTKGDGFKLRVR